MAEIINVLAVLLLPTKLQLMLRLPIYLALSSNTKIFRIFGVRSLSIMIGRSYVLNFKVSKSFLADR